MNAALGLRAGFFAMNNLGLSFSSPIGDRAIQTDNSEAYKQGQRQNRGGISQSVRVVEPAFLAFPKGR
jgi:hypothetical protein